MKLTSKSVRMSRSAEGRNASREMAIRGRAGGSRATLFDPDVVLTGRRFRRANGLTRIEAAELAALLRQPDDGSPPAVTLALDGQMRVNAAYSWQ